MHSIIGLALLATTAISSPVLETRQNALSGSTITLLPLGDSITWGYDDPTGNGYRGPLYSSLKSAGVSSLDFVGSLKNGNMPDPDNEGHVGWTISQIAGATSAISNLKPNVVLLHAGTNDAIQQNQPATGAIANLQSLCDQIFKQWPNTVLLVAKLIPEMNQSSRQAYINQINAAVPGIVSARASAGKKVAVVDMSNALVRSDYVEGTHPNQGGYAKMAALWMTGLQSAAPQGWLETSPSATSTRPPSSTMTPTSTMASTMTKTATSALPSSTPGSGTVAQYGQCGGQEYSGPTTCATGLTCKYSNPYYSQCL